MSIIRWANVFMLSVAQYIAAFFLFNKIEDWRHPLTDVYLHLLVGATALVVAAGYIINNFYDLEKDLINRPQLTLFQRLVSKATTLRVYFIFNAIAFVMAWVISWRALLFFGAYAAALWFYSHKVKKITLLGNIYAALMSIIPFFGIFLYYHFPSLQVWIYVGFIAVLVFMRELIKDAEAMKGDIILGYPTLAATYGWHRSRWIFLFSFLPLAGLAALLVPHQNMVLDTFIAFSAITVIIVMITTFQNPVRKVFRFVNMIFRLLIVGGIGMLAFLQG